VPFVGPGFIFVHVPKCAGKSMQTALGVPRLKGVGMHAPLSEVRDRRGLFAFGFVRNPWERQLSLYSFMCQTPKVKTWYDKQALINGGFKGWLLGSDWWTPEDRKHGREGVAPPVQSRPLSWWVDGCDFVGRFERLQTDFDRACALAGIGQVDLGHENTTEHPPYQSAYDAEMRAAVAEWFCVDIARWGYEF
jgi:hypothetical protein